MKDLGADDRLRGLVLLHYEPVRYRSDNDTTVSNLQANSNSLRLIRADSDLFQVQSFDFCGHKFSVVSLEPGGKLYTFTAGGQISAPDVPCVYFEARETSRSSTAVRGSDAFKVELRFREGGEFLFVRKLFRAAAFEAKQRAKQTQFGTAEVDLQDILLSHALIQAPPNCVQLSAICIGNLLVDHETLVFLNFVKFKAARAFEDALTKKGQLVQVFPLVHFEYR